LVAKWFFHSKVEFVWNLSRPREDLQQILADLQYFAATQELVCPRQSVNARRSRLKNELVQRSNMADSGPDLAQLTAQLQALNEQLAAVQQENASIKAQLAANQGSTSTAALATPSANTTAQRTLANRIHNPIKLDLPKFAGDGAGAARDFHRLASMLPQCCDSHDSLVNKGRLVPAKVCSHKVQSTCHWSYGASARRAGVPETRLSVPSLIWIENATEGYLIKAVVTRMTGHAAYWVHQWRVNHPTGFFRDLMTEFKHHFVDSRETETIARTQLYGSKQLTMIDVQRCAMMIST
jgi:hypothetical protein